jgi:hypothetical protein
MGPIADPAMAGAAAAAEVVHPGRQVEGFGRCSGRGGVHGSKATGEQFGKCWQSKNTIFPTSNINPYPDSIY